MNNKNICIHCNKELPETDEEIFRRVLRQYDREDCQSWLEDDKRVSISPELLENLVDIFEETQDANYGTWDNIRVAYDILSEDPDFVCVELEDEEDNGERVISTVCLHCEEKLEKATVFKDTLGTGVLCPKCNCSFDVE